MKDDQQLVMQLQDGVPGALERAVLLHHGFLLAMVKPLVGADLAQDVAQNTWMSAVAAIGKFESRSTLRTWLARIALNEARGMLRRSRRETSLDAMAEAPGSPIVERFKASGGWSEPPTQWHHDTPEALLTEAELQECIHKHLYRLPEVQRGVVMLRELGGIGFAEIATELGLSEGNVRVLLHRARQTLHAMLEHFEEEGTC